MSTFLNGHSDEIVCLNVLHTGKIVSGSKDGTLKFWE